MMAAPLEDRNERVSPSGCAWQDGLILLVMKKKG
jgi:hypothetical protein